MAVNHRNVGMKVKGLRLCSRLSLPSRSDCFLLFLFLLLQSTAHKINLFDTDNRVSRCTLKGEIFQTDVAVHIDLDNLEIAVIKSNLLSE